jgi:hypothetical protein
MGNKIRYVGTVDTPTDANQLDDLSAHLTRVAELHSLGLDKIDVDLGGGITQIAFETEVEI